MPISYYRHEAAMRSSGDCAIRKAAYYSRESIYFEGSCVLEAQIFDYSSRKGDLEYHNVLLPKGASEKFKDVEYLWNQASKAESRINAQEAWVGTLALPKESIFSPEDRIRIAEKFAEKYFVSNGLIAQVDIHYKQGNPHAHFLVTQRYLTENGKGFGAKARNLKDKFFQERWPFEAKKFLDAEFKAMGLDLRCDPPGIVAQKHLGLKGTWGRAFDLYLENQERIELNTELAKDPQQILKAITKYQSVFSPDDVERFINKQTPEDFIESVKETFWKQEEIIQMFDKKTGEKLDLFSVQEVVSEENHLTKLGDILQSRKAKFLPIVSPQKLNEEQRKAFYALMKGEGLMTLQGFAGTGKSYVLEAVARAYAEGGKEVYALGADNSAASALQEKGLEAQNVYRFLYKDHFNKENISKGSVIILDEAGKLGNGPMTELLKFADRKKAIVILSGDSAQFSPVERGGAFKYFCEKSQGPMLKNIQRQKDRESAEIAREISKGNTDYAIDRLLERKQIQFSDTRSEAMSLLGKRWAMDHADGKNNHEDSIIITATNKEAYTLSEMIRQTRSQWGDVSNDETMVKTTYGNLFFAKGDLIAFRGNDSEIGVENGMRGTVVKAKEDLLSVEVKESKTTSRLIHFNPKEYRKFHHGYAINANLSQGGTWKRVYFLHAPHLDRQMLYVAATRHINEFLYFVAKTDAPSIAAFKAQARRDGAKATTLECDNVPTLEMKAQEEQKIKETKSLKTSDRLKDNLRGYFREATSFFKEKIEHRGLKQKDPEFYNYHSRVQVHPKDESDKVNTKKTIEAMAAQREFVYSLSGEILNQVNPDTLFKAFLENNKSASEKRDLAEQEAKILGIPIERTDFFKELGQNTSKRNAIAKAFIEKAKWDDNSIRNTYGEDVEKLFSLSAKKFDQSFSLNRLKSNQPDLLFDLWKDRYAVSRELLKTVRLESTALLKGENEHLSYAESLLAAKEANWIAWGEVQRLSGDLETSDSPVLSEESKKLFSEEAASSLEKGAQAFEKALKPTQVFKEEGLKNLRETLQNDLFQEQKLENFKSLGERYREICGEISRIERKVGLEISKRTQRPKDCPSYKELSPELFNARKALAAHLVEMSQKEGIKCKEIFSEDILRKLQYQAESFEAKFQVNKTPYRGKIISELEPLKEKYISAQEKSFDLWRPLEIEAALKDKKVSDLSGFSEAIEAKSIMESAAFELKDSLKEMGKDPEDILDKRTLKEADRFEARDQGKREAFPDRSKDLEAKPQSQESDPTLKKYWAQVFKCKELKTLIEAEKEGGLKELGNAKSFKAWQVACSRRNRLAFELRTGSKDHLNDKAREMVELQAAKHDTYLKKQVLKSSSSLTEELKFSLEPLLAKLFPSGPSITTATAFRFGAKGSLSVTYCGEKSGQFYDFEKGEGGGPLKLIQNRLGMDKQEAVNWAREFVGLSANLEIPRQVQKKFPSQEPKEWVSLKPPANAPAPSDRQVEDYVETARYAYKNAKGELLHYVLRLEDKEGNKITPPLSYGYDREENTKPHWKMKGFDHGEEKRTLYNLDCLEKNPLAPVIVVEGEKTADAAPDKLKEELKNKETIAVTWMGGCGAVSKTDWTPLAGRDVLIWPDNDKGGFKAAKEIENELFRVGAKEIKTVDRDWLSKTFEEKWDLADPWPKGLKCKELKEKTQGVLCSKSRDSFLILSDQKNLKFGERLALGDIVSAYKEGRDLGECAFGEIEKEQRAVLRKVGVGALNIFKKEAAVFKRLGEDSLINAGGDLQKHLARQCTLFEARHGAEATLSEINLMKETIQESEKSLAGSPLSKMPRSELQCIKQRTFENLCQEALRGKELASNPQKVQNIFETESKEFSLALRQEKEITKNLEKAQVMEKDRSYGLSL